MSQVDSLRNRIQECDKNRPFIFISYKRSDAENVYPKVVELQEKGANVWIDKEMKSSVGRDWQSPAFQALNNVNCKVILFFVSKKSLVSPPVLAELLYSQEDKVKFRHKEKPLPILSFDLDNLIGMYGSISKYVQDNNDELSRNTLNKENLRAMFPDINFSKYTHIYDGIDNEFDLAYHILNAANLRDGKVILAAGIQEIIATLNQDYSEVFMKKTFVEQEYFNVSFDIDGKIRQEVVVKGTKLTEPEVPTPKEFYFIGWVYSTSDGETVWNFEKDTVESDLCLRARYTTVNASENYISLSVFLKKYNDKKFKKDTFSQFRLVGSEEFDKYSTDYFESAFDLTWSFVMKLLSERGVAYIDNVNKKHPGKNPVFITDEEYEKRADKNHYKQVDVEGLENYYMYRHLGQYSWIDSALKQRLIEFGLPIEKFGFEYKLGSDSAVTDTTDLVGGKKPDEGDGSKFGAEKESKPGNSGITGPIPIDGKEKIDKMRRISGRHRLDEFLNEYNNDTCKAESFEHIKLIGINGYEKYSIERDENDNEIRKTSQLVFNFAMRRLDEMGMEYIQLIQDWEKNSKKPPRNPIFITEKRYKEEGSSVQYSKVTSKSVSGYVMNSNYSVYAWLGNSLMKQLNALGLSPANFELDFES